MSKQFKLKKLNADQFAELNKHYTSIEARKASENYYHYLYTSALEYLDTGDVNILNAVVTASRMMHRIRLTSKIVKLFSCHKTNKSGKFAGKISQKRFDLLNDDRELLKQKMEALISADDEYKASKEANPFNVDSKLKQLARLIAQLTEHGLTRDEIDAKLAEMTI